MLSPPYPREGISDVLALGSIIPVLTIYCRSSLIEFSFSLLAAFAIVGLFGWCAGGGSVISIVGGMIEGSLSYHTNI